MAELGRRGGLASGKIRWGKRVGRILGECINRHFGVQPATDDEYPAAVREVWEATGRRFTLDQIAEALSDYGVREEAWDLDRPGFELAHSVILHGVLHLDRMAWPDPRKASAGSVRVANHAGAAPKMISVTRANPNANRNAIGVG